MLKNNNFHPLNGLSEADFIELEGVFPVLSLLSPLLRQASQQELRGFEMDAGKTLFDLGDPCLAYILLTSGSVRVIQPAYNGRELLLYRLEPGETCILTISCLLGTKPYPARGISETPIEGYLMSRAMFTQLVSRSDAFRHYIFSFFAERVANLMELIKLLTWGQLDRRLALIMIEKGRIIKATHRDLANEVGSVREVVSRILKEFEKKGLVHLYRKKIVVLDQAGLERIAVPFGDSSH
jgi:CRP/FNR family transcriptional regulator, anaerobic regulatory protein